MNRRVLILFAIIAGHLVVAALLLGTVERALDLYQRVVDAGPVATGIAVSVVGLFVVSGGYLAWQFLKPAPRRRVVRDEASLAEAVAEAQACGVDTAPAQGELDVLAARRGGDTLYISLYGDISTGKSALIRALVPGAAPPSDVRGGTTRAAAEYDWVEHGGSRLVLVDVPGLNDDGELSEAARAEAQRADLVVYLCDGDLTRSQWRELELLAAFDKPMVLALNKIDRYSADELELVRARVGGRILDLPLSYPPATATLVAGGTDPATGTPRAARLAELIAAIEQQLRADPERMRALRDQAILARAATQLDIATEQYRGERAGVIVRNNTRVAVVGALAAISPGSDLVIQGVVATKLVRELCDLFDARIRDVEIEALIAATNRRLGRSVAVLLAIAGNALKAFPGLGTVAGGLTHAVAYGLLFDTFGTALAKVLAETGEPDADATVAAAEEIIEGDLAGRARRIAALLVERGQS